MKGKETGRARKTFTTEVYLGRVRKIKEKDEEKDRERKREKVKSTTTDKIVDMK